MWYLSQTQGFQIKSSNLQFGIQSLAYWKSHPLWQEHRNVYNWINKLSLPIWCLARKAHTVTLNMNAIWRALKTWSFYVFSWNRLVAFVLKGDFCVTNLHRYEDAVNSNSATIITCWSKLPANTTLNNTTKPLLPLSVTICKTET